MRAAVSLHAHHTVPLFPKFTSPVLESSVNTKAASTVLVAILFGTQCSLLPICVDVFVLTQLWEEVSMFVALLWSHAKIFSYSVL